MDMNQLIEHATNFLQMYGGILAISNIELLVLHKITVKKLSKYDGCIIKNSPFINNKKLEYLKNKIDEEKIKDIKPLIQKIENYVSKDNLKNFYENLSTSKIKKNIEIIFGILGSYDIKKNKLSYSVKSSIGHELLHMASSSYNKEDNEFFSGFEQRKSGMTFIGKGLNEGYTEYLTEKIFDDKIRTYKNCVKIAKLIELFFENPKDMEKLYFNHDLPGLIHQLEKYAPRKEIIDLILKIDKVNNFSRLIESKLFSTYDYIKIQMTLYNWFKKINKDPEKLQKFEELLCENKIAKILVNKQQMKLCKENIYTSQDQRKIL